MREGGNRIPAIWENEFTEHGKKPGGGTLVAGWGVPFAATVRAWREGFAAWGTQPAEPSRSDNRVQRCAALPLRMPIARARRVPTSTARRRARVSAV